jgi:hypothetical protein
VFTVNSCDINERIYRLAGVIMAASDQVAVEQAIIVAEKIVTLLEEIKVYRYEATREHLDN